ncbi:hypothetical protein N7449_004217 [Penicillium cf. viridicatum]|uniref:Uncharacterized protein n=1 Tax=Penicillium cf. viridicatum TaxID=2972119 RepID=A0A9W9T540_9EURO|nr:hypothetical protein N7449_004217 [Penicillium cf. viridicatum]
MQGYLHSGPVDCTKPFDIDVLKGKTAIVTGANGLDEAYVRALVTAGARVCVGDSDEERGRKLEQELDGATFVRCDITRWDDQVRLFQKAILFSRTGKISHVIANAGIHRSDDIFSYSGDHQEPEEPNLSVVDVNFKGTLYTAKLAAHHFIRQNGMQSSTEQEDTFLTLIGSGAAFLDCPRAPQCCASKWAMRGIMHSLRRTAFFYGGRVNVISPWYVKTNILSDETFKHVSSVGVEFAQAEDAAQCLLRILSDRSINGHSLFVSGRKWASSGYIDLDLEDYPSNALIREIQGDQIKPAPVELGLFL